VITVLARLIHTLLYSLKTGVTRAKQGRNKLDSATYWHKCRSSMVGNRGTAGGAIPGQRAPIAPQAAVGAGSPLSPENFLRIEFP
jgi:hypothetical protein